MDVRLLRHGAYFGIKIHYKVLAFVGNTPDLQKVKSQRSTRD